MTDMNVYNGNAAAFNSLMGCTTTVVKENNLKDAFILFPNPASNNFQIDYQDFTGEAVVSVYDINGRSVFSKSLGSKTIIDVTTFSEGIYTVTIQTADNTITKKLVIVH
jgi:hypothetical protein